MLKASEVYGEIIEALKLLEEQHPRGSTVKKTWETFFQGRMNHTALEWHFRQAYKKGLIVRALEPHSKKNFRYKAKPLETTTLSLEARVPGGFRGRLTKEPTPPKAAKAERKRSPCIDCPQWGLPGWEEICAPSCEKRLKYADHVTNYKFSGETRQISHNEREQKREMGEIMPIHPSTPKIIEHTTDILLFPPKEKPRKNLYFVTKRHSQIRKLFREGKTINEIMQAVGLSRSTVNDVLRKIRNQKKTKKLHQEPLVKDLPVTASPMPDTHSRDSRVKRGTLEKTRKQRVKIRELYQAGKNVKEIVAKVGCSETTVRKLVPPEPFVKRGRGRPRIHPPEQQPIQKRAESHPHKKAMARQTRKGFWAWIIRISEYMMGRQSRRQERKVAKMLDAMTPEAVQAFIKKFPGTGT